MLPDLNKRGRVGVLFWRDPSLMQEPLSEAEYAVTPVRDACCRKSTIGLIRQRGDYLVASELTLSGNQIEFDQVTAVPRSLVFKVLWLEGRCTKKRR